MSIPTTTPVATSPQNYTITLNNKDVWQFYHDHPHIDPEEANLLFIDFIDTMLQKQDQSQSQLAAYVRESKAQLDALVHSLAKLQSDMVLQLNQNKREYMDDVRQIVGNQSLTVAEKMEAIVDKNNALLASKTSLLLNETLPHSLLKKADDAESRYQQPLFALVTATEDRLSKHLEGLRDTSIQQQTQQTKMVDELAEFLGKYKHNSSHKGRFGEQQLGALLTGLYPSAEVQATGTAKATGDFVLRRTEKAPILFENKDYDDNVPKEEVAKFIRDVDVQGMSGIFLSHRSGIVHKQNFQIDLNQGHVLVYVQHCGYDPDKVRIAVDIVDHFLAKMGDLSAAQADLDDDEGSGSGSGGEVVSKEVLDSINVEYQKFVVQREGLVTVVKDFQKKMTAQIDELQLPSLDKYLEPKFAAVRSASKNFTCDLCNAYCAASKQSLSAHKRGCKSKPTPK
jgi:hypothetical protein